MLRRCWIQPALAIRATANAQKPALRAGPANMPAITSAKIKSLKTPASQNARHVVTMQVASTAEPATPSVPGAASGQPSLTATLLGASTSLTTAAATRRVESAILHTECRLLLMQARSSLCAEGAASIATEMQVATDRQMLTATSVRTILLCRLLAKPLGCNASARAMQTATAPRVPSAAVEEQEEETAALRPQPKMSASRATCNAKVGATALLLTIARLGAQMLILMELALRHARPLRTQPLPPKAVKASPK